MNRRDAITSLLTLVVAGPLVARAQQTPPVIGYLSSSASANFPVVAAIGEGLKEYDFVDGRNVKIEYRWADGVYDRLPALAAELLGRQPAVIFAGGLPAALALKAATSTVPIVFVVGADPVKLGVVKSLRQPGGNITGVSQLYGALGAKRLELLRDLVPKTSSVAVITNPKNANAKDHLADVQAAARAIGWHADVFNVSSAAEIDAAYAKLSRQRTQTVLVADDPFFNVQRLQFVTLAARYATPAIYYASEFVRDGGLISYGSNLADNYRLAAAYVGKILKGAKPGDLPVLQPTKFELALNMQTAKALGIKIPNSILLRADKVIE